MNKTIAVTGASGHLGNVVCRLLVEKNYNIKAFYHTNSESLKNLPIELIQGDVLNKSDLERLIDGCEIVINCAAIISINGDASGTVFKTNTQGPKNVLEVSANKGVKRIIHISSVHAVLEEPLNISFDEKRPYKTSTSFAYDYSKAVGEQTMLHDSNKNFPEIVVVRPSCIIGPYDFKPSEFGKALMKFYNRKIPAMPSGGYNFVDVRDVANSLIEAIDKGKNGEVYLLTGKYYSMKDLSKMIQKVTSIKTPGRVIPYTILKSLIPAISLFSKITKSEPLFTIESINALKYGHPDMDNSKASSQLGHQCRSLEESLHDFYNWHHSNHRTK